MFRGLLFAFLVVCMGGYGGKVIAAPVNQLSQNLPSSFGARGLDPVLQEAQKPGQIGLIDEGEIFSAAKLIEGSFDSIASDSLSEKRNGHPAPSIEELMAVASLAPDDFGPGNHARRPNHSEPGFRSNAGTTVRELAQALINRPELVTANETQRADRNNDGGGYGYAVLNLILETQLNAEFIDTAKKVVNPTMDLDGVVTLNVFGLREFAFIMSPVSNVIQIMDFKTQQVLSLHNSSSGTPEPNQEINRGERRQTPATANVNRTLTLIKILKTMKFIVTGVLLHPVTLGIVLVLSMIISFRRIAKSA